MSVLVYNNTQINYEVSQAYGKLFLNSDVALGYGINNKVIDNHLRRNEEELIEGSHYIYDYAMTKGGRQRVIKWTSLGVYHLGFFIKSKQAKEFRKFMAGVANVIDIYKINDHRPQISENILSQILQSNQETTNAIVQMGKNMEAVFKSIIESNNNLTKKLDEAEQYKDKYIALLEQENSFLNQKDKSSIKIQKEDVKQMNLPTINNKELMQRYNLSYLEIAILKILIFKSDLLDRRVEKDGFYYRLSQEKMLELVDIKSSVKSVARHFRSLKEKGLISVFNAINGNYVKANKKALEILGV